MSTRHRFHIAAYAGFVWAAFQTAMMIYSGNLTLQTAAINVAPVLILSLGTLRNNRIATISLALYGCLRLWMAFPILSGLVADSAMPKHWWIALAAVPFALLWIASGSDLLRRDARSA